MPFYLSRFKDMEKKEFDVEIVTPMFLGGADPKKAELRAPSIKGALRFWWRVMNGGDDIKSLKSRENEIFGSTTEKASFDLRVTKVTDCQPMLLNLPKGKEFQVVSSRGKFRIGIIDYLAFGLRDFKTGYSKEHIPEENRFKLTFSIKNQKHSDDIINSFKMLLHYGGIGAKSRNGFGALFAKDIDSVQINSANNTGDFTGLSRETKLFSKFSIFQTWSDSLSEIGMVYKDARLSLEPKHKYSKRLLIAKPIVQTGSSLERHPKPYFLHVNKLPNGKYQGQILFMPYNYHDLKRRKEYFETCEKMNQKLSELSGGSK